MQCTLRVSAFLVCLAGVGVLLASALAAASMLQTRADTSAQDATSHLDSQAADEFEPQAKSEIEIDPFVEGPYDVFNFSIPAASREHPDGAPRALLVFAPTTKPQHQQEMTKTKVLEDGGSCVGACDNAPTPALALAPVILFLHGFNLKPEFYSQLLTHVSSHGFYAVAPEMYGFTANPDASGEIKAAAEIIQWLEAHLKSHINGRDSSPSFQSSKPGEALLPADVSRLCIAGHSRGGKEAYGVALGKAGIKVPYQAVIVLDPVDGSSNTTQTPPPILVHKENTLLLDTPVLVIGTGLGPLGKWGIFPACAPAWVGHDFFFSDAAPPAYHVRAKAFGHMDFLDDVTSGVLGKLTYTLCKNGVARRPMREFSGGVCVAFLKGVFEGKMEAFRNLLTDKSGLPVEVDHVQFKESERAFE